MSLFGIACRNLGDSWASLPQKKAQFTKAAPPQISLPNFQATALTLGEGPPRSCEPSSSLQEGRLPCEGHGSTIQARAEEGKSLA